MIEFASAVIWMASIVSATGYGCLIVPDAPGAVNDLAMSKELADVINHLMDQKSRSTNVRLFTPELTTLHV